VLRLTVLEAFVRDVDSLMIEEFAVGNKVGGIKE
jgi:hypothetical protein